MFPLYFMVGWFSLMAAVDLAGLAFTNPDSLERRRFIVEVILDMFFLSMTLGWIAFFQSIPEVPYE